MSGKLTYKAAGQDLDRYNETLSPLFELMRRTYSPRVLELSDGFAALFSLDYNSRLFARNYRHPVLAASTDGVGTKLKVAFAAGRHDTVGIDLVAMSVNDCLATGAEPLLFLDYLALPQEDPKLVKQLVGGISKGCLEADCALVGGETAILPGFYQSGEYDMAGFCVGIVERERIVDGRAIRSGDTVLGLASTGLHSNGYSLARKVFFEAAGLQIGEEISELGGTAADVLLEPTRIYVRTIKNVLEHYRVKHVVRGLAHITGGGLVENIERILPEGRQVVLRKGSWPVPKVFRWIEEHGPVDEAEMYRVFNMGIGFVIIASPYYTESIVRQLADDRVPACAIGEVRDGPRGVVWE